MPYMQKEYYLLAAEGSMFKQKHGRSIRVCMRNYWIVENEFSLERNSSDINNHLLAVLCV